MNTGRWPQRLPPEGHDARLIGRSRDLHDLGLAMGPGGDGTRCVLVRGQRGIGKTTLVESALDQAAQRGFSTAVVWARGAADPCAAIERARVRAGEPGARHMVLAIESAELLDAACEQVLLDWISRAPDLSLLLVGSRVSPDHPRLRQITAAASADCAIRVVEVAPLPDEAIRSLARACRAWADHEQPMLDRLVHDAGGNPALARELCTAPKAARLPLGLVCRVEDELATLARAPRELVEILAVADVPLLESEVSEVARKGPVNESTEQLLGSSDLVTRRADGRLQAAQPGIARAVREQLTPGRRRELHHALAQMHGNQERVAWQVRQQARHVSQAGEPRRAAELLVSLAREEALAGEHQAATGDLCAASELHPEPLDRVALLREASCSAFQTGDGEALPILKRLLTLAANAGDDEAYGFALFHLYWSESDGRSVERLDHAILLDPTRVGWAARAAACARTLGGDYEAAIRLDEQAAEIGAQRGDKLLVALATEKQALAWSWQGNLVRATELYRIAVRELVELGLHRWALLAWTNLADILLEQLDIPAALEECAAARECAIATGAESMVPRVDAQEALVHWRAGNLVEAAELAERAYGPAVMRRRDHMSAVVALIYAGVLIDAGDVSSAAPAVTLSEELARENGCESFAFEARFCRAALAACARDIVQVDGHLEGLEIDEPLSIARLALFVSRLRLTSHTPGCERELTRLRRLLVPESSPYARLAAEEIEATDAALASGNPERLVEAAASWTTAGLRLDALRAQLLAGLLLFSRGRTEEARPFLETARLGLNERGARADAGNAANALRELGRNVSVRTAPGTAQLTRRELDVAWHVARGLRNAEIAERMLVTEHAIKRHLNRTYRKLGITSRVQLASWLQEQAPEHSAELAG